MKNRFVALALMSLSLGVASCSIIPPPAQDPTHYYLLNAVPGEKLSEINTGLVLGLRNIDVASYLRSRSLVVRKGGNEVQFREFARWGEPLEAGVGRVLKEDILSTGVVKEITTVPFSVDVERDFDLNVRVLACEGGSDGTIYFRASWQLLSTGAGAELLATGNFNATDLKWDGISEASLAAGLSQAIAALAKEVGLEINRQ